MAAEFDELSNEESLRAENEFLKMKMMLEHGAHFSDSTEEISAEMENEFLRQVMEFEKQYANPTYVTVYEKINKPTHFKAVSEISDDDIEKELEDLLDYLDQYFINLDVCSPNIKPREIYRFAMEELFNEKMEDFNIPGMVYHFVYDEYHPDPVFENSKIATDNCLAEILSSQPMDYMFWFRRDRLQLNEHRDLNADQFKEKIQLFKDSYDFIADPDFSKVECHVEDGLSFVKGFYRVQAHLNSEVIELSGKWLVNIEKDPVTNCWDIVSVQVEGVRF